MNILKEHNVKTYLRMVEVLKRYNRCAVVQATGTGKSFIAMQLMLDYFVGKSKLVIAPQSAILDNFAEYRENDFKDIDYMTYTALARKTDEEIFDIAKSHSLIVLDEMHRAGAKVWNQRVNKLLSFTNAGTTIIGLTATPIRYLDNSRNMAEELFGNNVVEGIDIEHAIALGILPKFDYVSDIFRVEGEVERYKKKLSKFNGTNNLIARFRLNLENSQKIGDIIRKHTRNITRNQKWIVFCESIEQISEIDSDIKDWFGNDVNIYKIHSKIGKKQNSETQAIFNAKVMGISVIVTVDMFNEGVHIKNLTGVIMLRKTSSPIVYKQQLGRALAVSNSNRKVIIFDLVGNNDNIRTIHATGAEVVHIANVSNELSQDKADLCIVKDYSIEMKELFDKIDKVTDTNNRTPYMDFRRQVYEMRMNDNMNAYDIHKIVGKGYSLKDVRDVLIELHIAKPEDMNLTARK